VIFKYCDDNKMPLLDLKDLKKVVQFATEEGKQSLDMNTKISPTSTGVILESFWNLSSRTQIFSSENSPLISETS